MNGNISKLQNAVLSGKGGFLMKELTKQRIVAAVLSVLPMGIYFIVYLLLTIVSMAASTDSDMVNVLLHAASMVIASVVMCMVLKKRTGKRFTDTLSVRDFDIVIPLLLLVFTWCAGEVLDGIVAGVCSEFMAVRQNPNPEITPAHIVSAIIVAPVFEEIINRYLGTEFAEEYYPLSVLCIANAFYFTILHGYNIQGVANVMVYGVCSAYVYLKTKRLFYLIPVHMCHNALCMIDYGNKMFFGSPINKEKNGFVLASPQWVLFNIAVAVVCAFICYNRYIKVTRLRMAA